MNRVIALACAVEPLAFSVCLPPQSTFVELAYEGVDFSLAHAESTQHVAASKSARPKDRFVKCAWWFPPVVSALCCWWGPRWGPYY